MSRKPLRKTFNFHLRKKPSFQDNDENPPEQDTGSSLIEPIASRRHSRNAKVRCIKSLSKIIKDETRFDLRERARARVASESEEQRKMRLENMRRFASKRLAAESTELRQRRLHDLRRRAAQRIERERRRKERKHRNAVQLSYLPSDKCAVSPYVTNDALQPNKSYKIVVVSTSKAAPGRRDDDREQAHIETNFIPLQQQQSESTNSTEQQTHNENSGSQEIHNFTSVKVEDDDVEYLFNIDIKVEPYTEDAYTTDGFGDWNQSNDEVNSNRSRQNDRWNAAEPEMDDTDTIEEPLDDEFNNVVLERTLLMMCRGD